VATSEPGTCLPTERELCAKLGVGRSTLREAIRSLTFMGVVRPRQGSGTYVTSPEDQAVEKMIALGLTFQRAKVQDIIEARRVLEVEVARLAAERYTESDRSKLETIMSAMSASGVQPAEASHCDLQYHVSLARASHNVVLVHLINGMRALLEIWMNRAVNRVPVIVDIVREHNSILEAVLKRDAEQASVRMSLHLTNAAERLFSVVGKEQLMADYLSLLLGGSNES
ncbi:MAG TPA: FadR/GntR family transcriptional regulator, partial [Terriglobia bacterium]|nr:FadR/GntR family transcriptional regulator [Terriglobia bacterium]